MMTRTGKSLDAADHQRRRVVATADGSTTLFLPSHQEHYHSVHGAQQESAHVFVAQGLKHVWEGLDRICILEVGLGTGLNCLMTLGEALKSKKEVQYVALEPHPLLPHEYRQLKFPFMEGRPPLQQALLQLHQGPFGGRFALAPAFDLEKIPEGLQKARLPDSAFHLVYFDAFAPEVQPDMWTPTCFAKVFAAMKPGGILVTYCAKGAVKRAMRTAGFMLQHPPGATGKREMTRACKPGTQARASCLSEDGKATCRAGD